MTIQATAPTATPPNPAASTPPGNSGPPAAGPGISPPQPPAAGVEPGVTPPVDSSTPAPGQPEPPAPSTPEPPNPEADRVVPAADAYVLPPGAPEGLGQWANQNQFTQTQLDNAWAALQASSEHATQQTMEGLKAQGDAHIASWGEKAPEMIQTARAALIQMDPEQKLTTLLRETGYANHPVVLDFLYHLGHNMKEGGFLKSPSIPPKGGAAKTPAQAMYGNSHPSKQ